MHATMSCTPCGWPRTPKPYMALYRLCAPSLLLCCSTETSRLVPLPCPASADTTPFVLSCAAQRAQSAAACNCKARVT